MIFQKTGKNGQKWQKRPKTSILGVWFSTTRRYTFIKFGDAKSQKSDQKSTKMTKKWHKNHEKLTHVKNRRGKMTKNRAKMAKISKIKKVSHSEPGAKLTQKWPKSGYEKWPKNDQKNGKFTMNINKITKIIKK